MKNILFSMNVLTVILLIKEKYSLLISYYFLYTAFDYLLYMLLYFTDVTINSL